MITQSRTVWRAGYAVGARERLSVPPPSCSDEFAASRARPLGLGSSFVGVPLVESSRTYR